MTMNDNLGKYPEEDFTIGTRAAPNRFLRPALSSGARRLFLPGLLLISTAALAIMAGPELLPQRSDQATPGFSGWNDASLQATINEWRRLRGNDSLPFQDYAAFLAAHPGWPGDTAMRKAAERRIDPNNMDARAVVMFFTRLAPLTATGQARYAEALSSTGRPAEARAAAVAAWTTKGLTLDDESRLMARFGSQLTSADHDRRMERLLWDRSAAAASRQIGFASDLRRPVFAARLALQTNTADIADKAMAAGEAVNHDPGYLLDRARWMRDHADSAGARAWLAQPRTLNGLPFDPANWLNTLLSFAQAAAADGQNELVYAIARHAEEAFPAGTVIRNRPFDERDDYTSLVWLAGTTALKKLDRPADAMTMFDRYARAAQSPQSQTKGWYWAGRAAEKAGRQDWARGYLAQAALHVDQFYGQLATERLGRDLTMPPEAPRSAVPPTERASFDASEVVRAARLLGRTGQWQDQTVFLRLIAQNAKTDTDHILAGELALSIDRPDLGVMVSRAARTSGTADPLRIGFPQVKVPPAMDSHWTMIHAISRQESQFDREATSRTGARGLMQLMPATAREQAGKMGMDFDSGRLGEAAYNVMLGSAFFDRMLTYYNGSYVLAVASYNAGPGNVNKFIRANGDPRMPGVDVVDWIEAIPFTETRGYVQRVLENAVVYDLLNPSRSPNAAHDRLSAYLGKSSPG
jgi:soluble lytic murein transglycosylase